MRSKSTLSLIAALGSMLCSANVQAGWPPTSADTAARWHRLGRTLGVGWSDGYHACARRDHRLGDNLPPRDHLPPPISWQNAAALSAPQLTWADAAGQPPVGAGPTSAPAPLPQPPLPQPPLPQPPLAPSVLESSAPEGASPVSGEPSDRVSRVETVEGWKWVREPNATQDR